MDNDFQALQQQLEVLNKNIKTSNSYWRSAVRGLISGVAGTIGASLVAGIIIAVLAQTIHSVHDIPIINRLISTTHLDEILQSPAKR